MHSYGRVNVSNKYTGYCVSFICFTFNYSMLFVSCCAILLVLSCASPLQKFLTVTGAEGKNENSNGDIWALLVAGSTGWINYRHQVDGLSVYSY